MRTLNILMQNLEGLKPGDFLLFQIYESDQHREKGHPPKHYKVSVPIYAITLGAFVCDQAIGINYVRVPADVSYYSDEPKVEVHIEWNDYIDVLGRFEKRPTFRELLSAYRKRVHDIYMPYGAVKCGNL
jgi:hypothetical protein